MKAILNKFINPGSSLRWRAIQGGALVVFTEVYKQGIRLGGNLIMTRLLYPEAFGMMLIVTLVLVALEQFSDAGVRLSVILHSRGREEQYLNTAWVIMSYRGIILTIIALLSAWPLSVLYDNPDLAGLIVIASATALITGFASPQNIISERDVKRFKLMLFDIIPQTISMVLGVTILFFYPSVWVLALMGIISSLVTTFLSFILFPSRTLKFKADKVILLEIFNFGKWIFVATALTFLVSEGYKVIVSGILDMKQLGIFSIAITFAKLVDIFSGNLSTLILMPVYKEIDYKEDKETGRKKIIKIKLAFFALMSPLVIVFCLFGSFIINLLYDDRYINAGWMLQIMSLGGLFAMVNHGFIAVVFSKGDSKAYLKLIVMLLISFLSIISICGYFFNIVGIVYGIAIAPVFSYMILSYHVRQYDIGSAKFDILLFALILTPIFLIWYFNGWPGPV